MGTSKSNAYYQIVSRLRKANLQFRSVLPSEDSGDCELVLTTAEEVARFGERAMDIGSLSDDPGVFKGQILSRLTEARETLLIGVDPGKRIGMAAFYGDAGLAFITFGSISSLCSSVAEFVGNVPARKAVVRVGNGNPVLSVQIGELLNEHSPGATTELVDEAGTSARSSRTKGLQGDASAAAKIAFRKGIPFSSDGSRTRR